jgi:hypothetical protein
VTEDSHKFGKEEDDTPLAHLSTEINFLNALHTIRCTTTLSEHQTHHLDCTTLDHSSSSTLHWCLVVLSHRHSYTPLSMICCTFICPSASRSLCMPFDSLVVHSMTHDTCTSTFDYLSSSRLLSNMHLPPLPGFCPLPYSAWTDLTFTFD